MRNYLLNHISTWIVIRKLNTISESDFQCLLLSLDVRQTQMTLTLTRGRWPSPCPQKHNNTPHYNACLPAHTPVSQRTTLPLTFTYLHPQPLPSQYNSSHASTRTPTRVSSWRTEAREWGGRHHGWHASRRSIRPHGVGQGWVRCTVAASSSRWRLHNIPHTTVVSFLSKNYIHKVKSVYHNQRTSDSGRSGRLYDDVSALGGGA